MRVIYPCVPIGLAFGLGAAPAAAQCQSTWTPVAASGPLARAEHAMVYDAARNRVVLFGGQGASGVLGDLWEWDGVAWSERSVGAGPGSRYGHAMAFDTDRARTVLFGGRRSTGEYLGDTWEYDGQAWVLVPYPFPPARSFAGMAYSAAEQLTILYGGSNASMTFRDTWNWNGAQWILFGVGGPVPLPSASPVLVYESAALRLLMAAGANGTWAYTGTWQQISATPMVPRAGHAAAYDEARSRTTVVGGFSLAGIPLAAAWVWDGQRWLLAGAGPGARTRSAIVYHPPTQRLILFGGSRRRGPARGGHVGLGWAGFAEPARVHLWRRWRAVEHYRGDTPNSYRRRNRYGAPELPVEAQWRFSNQWRRGRRPGRRRGSWCHDADA